MFRRFLSELKRRRVIRVAGVYAVTCWAIFQVATNLFPALHLPAWTVTLSAVLLILGFPIAVIIAWAFEPSPDGMRLTPGPGEGAPIQKLAWSDWALAVVALGIIGVSVAQMGGVHLIGARAPASEPATAAKSIAVLPFVNFSEQKDSELFADGLTEEVINSLAQIPDLKVAGRTSAFYFKDRNEDLRLIGQKLGVSHVLEGSVRREGARLRVTVQLIKVADGFHMWSETYDRNMDDTFAIQTEIAGKVAGVMKAKLMASPTAASLSPEAYRTALVARTQLRRLGLRELTDARAAFKGLIDSGQADAGVYAGYAQSTIMLAQNHLALDYNEADAESEAAIARALSLDPNSADAYLAKGARCIVRTIRLSDQACVAEAAAAYARAAALKPRDPDVLTGYANFLLKRREAAKAHEMLKRALAVDPLNRVALMLSASALSSLGQADAAEQGYRQVVALYPDFIDAKQDLGQTLLQSGKLDQAEPWLRAAAAPGTDPSAAIQLASLYLNLGLTDNLNATLAGMKSPPTAAAAARAVQLVVTGDYPKVLAFSEAQMAKDHDPLWLSVTGNMLVMTGEYEKARRLGLQFLPDLFSPEPNVDVSLAGDAVAAAFVDDRLGDHAQARRVLDKVLALTTPRPGEPLPPSLVTARLRAYALLGDKDRAVGVLADAVRSGFRCVWSADDWVRIDAYPETAPLRDDPRFVALVRRMEADNARMRALVLASRR